MKITFHQSHQLGASYLIINDTDEPLTICQDSHQVWPLPREEYYHGIVMNVTLYPGEPNE